MHHGHVLCGRLLRNSRAFDVQCVLFFGLLGLFFKVFKIPSTPLIIGFILGSMFEENLRQADPSLFALEGMDNDLASKLVGAGVKTADELGDLDTEELVEKTGLDEEAASKLIMAARASWAE